MKNLYFFIVFILISTNAFSQNSISFHDEVNVSINHTTINGFNPNNKFGFGVGYHRLYRDNKTLKPTFGFEFNQINFFKEKGNYGHMYHEYDIDVQMYNISIPVGIQFQKSKFFVEAGGYIDFSLLEKGKGMVTDYIMREDGIPSSITKPLVYKGKGVNVFGLYYSTGYIFTMSKREANIKAEFKSGFKSRFDDSTLSYIRIILGLKI